MRLSNEQVKNTVKTVVNLVASTAILTWPYRKELKTYVGKKLQRGGGTYADAVGAISNSNMFSSEKMMAISMLPKDGNAELYKAVIQIVNSNMFNAEKVNTIAHICGGEA